MSRVMNNHKTVKMGNWFEDLRLKEDEKTKYEEEKERGELLYQKMDSLRENMLRPVSLTVTTDGRVHFGDVVMLVNLGGDNRECSAISINADFNSLTKTPTPGIKAPCGVSAGRNIQACTRTAFIITSVDGSPAGSTLHYEQSFALKTTCGFARGLYLMSDRQSFQKCIQEVNLDEDCSFLSQWKIVHFDPQERLENEGQPVPANLKVLIKHCKTNQAIAALGDQVLWTTFGKEYEVTTHTFLDSHKAETDTNHWILCTSDPAGNGLVLFNHPQLAADNQELTQANPGT
ncbi:cilia- and flagella-associated protein 161 isoform X1 [Xyrichtys novacula]|uniref:Cilia- and flagella-associated protein 161 isoform X1 n=1 Tax=Xyrichtys novacula TaxID=13765 RepID=A0AAV1F810_XYRNO|nr:cilia- and flagella-associated protein 161 isoform X1 [Xyrichtys novacula]